MSMSISYEETGRTKQKARTRKALVEAARELLSKGFSPAVEAAADIADVSRATAYRYFPNQRALLAAAAPVIEADSLLGPDPPEDVEERLELVARALSDQIVANEPALRTMLRLSLEREPPEPKRLVLRRGRAIGWIEDALAPLKGQLAEDELNRLAVAIRAAVGIEPFVWLTDIAGLSREEAVNLMCRSARALLRDALAGLDDSAGN
jgi:AcrR family transcriptional regulator